MNSGKIIKLLLIVCVFTSSFISCSRSDVPNSPQIIPEDNLPAEIAFGNDNDNQRNIISAWNVEIDPETEHVSIKPANRQSTYHVPLNNIYPNTLTIDSFDFGPPFTADIRITHPQMGSGIDGFDPRVIANLPANSGVSMNYPALNISANNSVVINPDGYIQLWDNPAISGNTNPFIAYFKDHTLLGWSLK